MTVGEGHLCRSCGRPLIEGVCPNCRVQQARVNDTSPAGPSVVSDRGPILEKLAVTIGPVTRILLSDTDNGTAEPTLVNPSSPEMPAPAERGVRVQLLGEIARGGMGVVLKGRDPDLGRDLAVKVLLEAHRGNPDLVRRFVEEAQIGGQLQHPGVVPIYDLGTFGDGRPYFTMKLVKGQTLSELLAERKSPADQLPRFLEIFQQVCQTMAYAHARDVIHRDLKPSNVMVGNFGEVQVMDWGLAKVLPKGGVVDDAAAGRLPADKTVIAARVGSDSDLSMAGSVMGTPAYMAPEQARGEIEFVDERADVFALGSILCEVLTGKPAFVGRNAGELHRKAAVADLADAMTRLEQCDVDAELTALAALCLAREAEDRLRDAGLVAERMTTYRAGVEIKLRQAEIARATEEARAEEEAKRRVLADALAHEAEARALESRRTAETAQAKAKAEAQARRMTGALAAALIVLVLASVAGYTVYQRQQALRSEQVDLALRDASRLYDEAKRNGDDLARWRGAVEAARAVERLLADAPDQATKAQAVALVQSVTSGLRAAENDQKLLERLIEIRSAEDDDPGYSITNLAYSRAFRDAEIDVDALSPSQAAERIKVRPPRVAIAISAALDDWARARHDKLRDRAGALRVSQAAHAADPDPWRNRLRDALEIGETKKRLSALRELAGSAKVSELPAVSLDLLGSALREAGDPELALKVLREAQRLIPDDVWLNYDLASCLELLARRNEAIRFYIAARSIRPEVAHTLAHALDQNGEPDQAIALFHELTRLRPNTGRNFRCLGVILRTRGRAQEADIVAEAGLKLLREEVRERPDDLRAATSLGRALTDLGKHQEAIDEIKRSLRTRPDDADLHIALGSALQAAGKIDAAIEEFRAALKLDPRSSFAHGNLASALAYGKNDYAAGEAEMRETLRLDPESHSSHETMGDILARQGKFPEAIAEFRIAASIDRTCGHVRRFLGNALRDSGKREEALAEYRESIRLRPDDGSALNEFDKLLADMGKVDVLIEEYRAMLRVRPNSDVVLNSFAWRLVLPADRPKSEYEEALKDARKSIEINARDANHWNTLALAEYRARHWDESIAASQRAISITDGGSAGDWFFIAMAHVQKGKKDEARPWYRKAVAWTKEKDPKNSELLQFWKEAANLLGEPGPPALGAQSASEKPQ